MSAKNKYHSHSTRSTFLFPITLVIPQETIVYPAAGGVEERQGEDRGKGEKYGWTAKINASTCSRVYSAIV